MYVVNKTVNNLSLKVNFCFYILILTCRELSSGIKLQDELDARIIILYKHLKIFAYLGVGFL